MSASKRQKRTFSQDFKGFFLRGLGIILPTILTLGLIFWVYGKIQTWVAQPINSGLREVVVRFTDWPKDTDDELDDFFRRRSADPVEAQAAGQLRTEWNEEKKPEVLAQSGLLLDLPQQLEMRRNWMRSDRLIYREYRRWQILKRWDTIAIGKWHVLDLIGLVIAVILIYMIGLLLGSFIGRSLYARGESLIDRVPLIRRIYPAFKQIAEFVVPDPDAKDKKEEFSRVVAVQYPRKGIWSVGMVTGNTLQRIQTAADSACLTVFIPSSPTPFTGYVITVPVEDTVDLPITVEDALKFAISGGVLVPPNQMIPERERPSRSTQPATETSPTGLADASSDGVSDASASAAPKTSRDSD